MKKIKFSLNDINLGINELKTKFDNSKNMTLEINLLSEENRVSFTKLHNELQNNYSNIFPLTIKLNEKLKDDVIIHFN